MSPGNTHFYRVRLEKVMEYGHPIVDHITHPFTAEILAHHLQQWKSNR